MVQDGKLTPEEASQLLEALEMNQYHEPSQPAPAARQGPKGRIFRVQVTDVDTGKRRVDVRLPLKLVNAGLKAGLVFAPEIDGLDLSELSEAITSRTVGTLAEIYDESDGESVKVTIE